MIKNIKKLTVKYNGIIVGYLAEIDDDSIAFEYDEKWLEDGFSISPLSLPLIKKVYIRTGGYFSGLYGVFKDSLPDGFGELLFRRKLSNAGINFDKLSPLTKLSLVRENGLGALYYEPAQTDKLSPGYIDLDAIAADVQKIYDDQNNVDIEEIYKLGGSSGGARPKVHIKVDDEYWIVKFWCRHDPSDIAKIEYSTNMLAVRCGLNVNECKLFNTKSGATYFGAKRFDRNASKRIHMVSLSSLLETTHRIANLDYTHLFQVVEHICDKTEMYEVFRRMSFNVFAKNRDDHGKNFSFIYNEKTNMYSLSPAYDLTPTVDKAEHEMTVCGKGKPLEEDMLVLASKFNLNRERCLSIIKHIKKITCFDK